MPNTLHDLALDEAQEFLRGGDLAIEPNITRVGYYGSLRMSSSAFGESGKVTVTVQCDAFEPELVDWTNLLVRFGSAGRGSLAGYAFLNRSGFCALEMESALVQTLRAVAAVRTPSGQGGREWPAVAILAEAGGGEPGPYAERYWHDFLWLIEDRALQIRFQRRANITLIAAFAPGDTLSGARVVVSFVPSGGGTPFDCPVDLEYEREIPWGVVNEFDLLVESGAAEECCTGVWEDLRYGVISV